MGLGGTHLITGGFGWSWEEFERAKVESMAFRKSNPDRRHKRPYEQILEMKRR